MNTVDRLVTNAEKTKCLPKVKTPRMVYVDDEP